MPTLLRVGSDFRRLNAVRESFLVGLLPTLNHADDHNRHAAVAPFV
jgi:hypothetical protein